MSLSSPSRLPPEIYPIILQQLAWDFESWDVTRKYLHLRLVSSWFGAAFEEAAFRKLHVDITASSASSSNHLVKLLRTNAKLAGNVEHLNTGDLQSFSELVTELISVQSASGAFEECVNSYKQALIQQRIQLAALVQGCKGLQGLCIHSSCPAAGAPARFSLFSRDMKDLRVVLLQDAALVDHFRDYVQAGLSQTLLAIVISTSKSPFTGTPQSVAATLTSELTSPAPSIRGLGVEAPLDFTVPFLANLPLRPGTLTVSLPDYDRLREVVDAIIEGPALKTMQELQFNVTHSSPSVNASASNPVIVNHLDRIRAAGPADLTISMQVK